MNEVWALVAFVVLIQLLLSRMAQEHQQEKSRAAQSDKEDVKQTLDRRGYQFCDSI